MEMQYISMGPRWDFPVLRIGNRMVVSKEQFIQWVAAHTGGGTS